MRLACVYNRLLFLLLFYRFLTRILRLFTDALLLAKTYFFFPLMFSLYIRCSMT